MLYFPNSPTDGVGSAGSDKIVGSNWVMMPDENPLSSMAAERISTSGTSVESRVN